MKLRYYTNCCNFPNPHAKGGLIDMIDNNIEITRKTFLKYVNREDLANLEQALGFESHPAKGLTMAGCWDVSYHRSKLYGKRVYYFRSSSIEYIFR